MCSAVKPMVTRLLWVIALLAGVGIAVSSVSLYEHYRTSQASFCDLGQTFNCDIVNRSAYSEVAGIPVAFIGILGYLLLLFVATLRREHPTSPLILLIAASVGLAFALYLAYVEKFILGAWCILCLTSLSMIAAIVLLSTILILAGGSSEESQP
jgi:vitamin-K-epoxide reductase (warfarin-sensitive)